MATIQASVAMKVNEDGQLTARVDPITDGDVTVRMETVVVNRKSSLLLAVQVLLRQGFTVPDEIQRAVMG